MFPSRFQNPSEARRTFGPLVDHYGAFLSVGDPLADAVVEDLARMPRGRGYALIGRCLEEGVHRQGEVPDSVARLFARLEHTPAWVDFSRVAHGAMVFQRLGVAATLVLSTVSLMRGYYSAAINRPLVFTAQLDEDARFRLGHTGRYVYEVCQRRGLERGGEGFRLSVFVRLMHAKVRRMILDSGRWDSSVWGVPINSADMCATGLSFSIGILVGAEALGYHFDEDEANDLLHLWRYASWLMGVHPDLLWENREDAALLSRLIDATLPGPDAWSAVLASALRQTVEAQSSGPMGHLRLNYFDGLTRALHGDSMSDALGIPDTPWTIALPLTRALVQPLEALRRATPGANLLLARRGNKAIADSVERSLEGRRSTYPLPNELRGAERFELSNTPSPGGPRFEGAVYDSERSPLQRLGRRAAAARRWVSRAMSQAGVEDQRLS